MSDQAQVLKEALGMPLVWLYDNNGQPLKFIDETYNSSVERTVNRFIFYFQYVYDEENDDECTIKMQFQNIKQANAAYISEDSIIKIQWGYALPGGEFIKSPTRKIVVRNVDTNQEKNRITVDYKCTDLVSYLKLTKSNVINKANYFEDWVKEVVDGKFVARILLETQTIIILKDQDPLTLDPITGKYYQAPTTKGNSISKIDFEMVSSPGKSVAIANAIEAATNKLEVGPLHLDGRDDILSIRERDWKQKSFGTYTYAGATGEVISFKTKTNLKTRKLNESEVSGTNPYTKEVVSETQDMQAAKETNVEITPEESAAAYNELMKIYKDNVANPGNQSQPIDFTINRKAQVSLPTKFAYGQRDRLAPDYLPGIASQKFNVPIKQFLTSASFNDLYVDNTLKNYNLKKMEKLYTAKLRIVGDPTWVSSKVVDVLNVVTPNKGRWYVLRVEHIMDPKQGFVTVLHCIRKPKDLGIIKTLKKDKKDGSDPDISQIVEKVYGAEATDNTPYDALEYDTYDFVKKLTGRTELNKIEEVRLKNVLDYLSKNKAEADNVILTDKVIVKSRDILPQPPNKKIPYK